ncbi:conserved hypothetical protein [Ricinus communis]|uniref:Uncharacterized protein n=1 Tax=Ricinus communis TaxID=3988 RepID=B9SX49_RICCO|nr:conserved hypothetical protein [Ricinus communis]
MNFHVPINMGVIWGEATSVFILPRFDCTNIADSDIPKKVVCDIWKDGLWQLPDPIGDIIRWKTGTWTPFPVISAWKSMKIPAGTVS